DEKGRLEDLPFMPEMLRYCGIKVRVVKRAHKTCDPALGIGGRKMANTVHLENLRCDGANHDGCEAGCFMFWKEAWLRRVESEPGTRNPEPTRSEPGGAQALCTEEAIRAGVKITADGDSEPTYMCQNTQIKFATQALPWWDLRQYAEDYTSGNVRLSE